MENLEVFACLVLSSEKHKHQAMMACAFVARITGNKRYYRNQAVE
jgi:hypothetical protein